jgi:5-methylcytosine-specific restriction endonuclease McrA
MRAIAKYCCLQHKKNAASKRHRERNPGYFARYSQCERQLAWRERNKERIRAVAREQARRYREANPDYARKWREANHVYYQVRQRNRAAMKFANTDSVGVSERDWARLCRRYAGCCAYCGDKPDSTLEMDHVIPLTKGGRHAIGNVLPACRACNVSKGANYLAIWLRRKAYALMAEMYGGAA